MSYKQALNIFIDAAGKMTYKTEWYLNPSSKIYVYLCDKDLVV